MAITFEKHCTWRIIFWGKTPRKSKGWFSWYFSLKAKILFMLNYWKGETLSICGKNSFCISDLKLLRWKTCFHCLYSCSRGIWGRAYRLMFPLFAGREKMAFMASKFFIFHLSILRNLYYFLSIQQSCDLWSGKMVHFGYVCTWNEFYHF